MKVVHRFAAKTNSSNRVRAAANALENPINHRLANDYKASKRAKRNIIRNAQRKETKLSALPCIEIDHENSLSRAQLLRSEPAYYEGGVIKKIDSLREDVNEQARIERVGEDGALCPYDSKEGGLLLDANGGFVALLVPSNVSKKRRKKNHFETALTWMRKMKTKFKTTHRGAARKGSQDGAYALYAMHPQRGGKGIKLCAEAKKLDPKEQLDVIDFVAKAENMLAEYLPTTVLSNLNLSMTVSDWEKLSDEDRNKSSSLFTGVTCSCNYFSLSHLDDDFFISALTCVVDHVAKNATTTDDEVATYFCFPEQGRAIGVRPGDYLLFNPLSYHCCSSKTDYYNDDDVYCSTCYLKSKNVGLNDNSVQLSEVQEFFLEQDPDLD